MLTWVTWEEQAGVCGGGGHGIDGRKDSEFGNGCGRDWEERGEAEEGG